MLRRFEGRGRWAKAAAGIGVTALLAGCGTILLNETGSLTRYDRLEASSESTTRARLYVDTAALAEARTVRIIPAEFPVSVAGPDIDDVERRLIANAADRALCYELSLRYDVVSTRKADLTVRAVVTRFASTNVPAAGTTIATSAGISVASQLGVGFATSVGRVPIPRIPIGLGSLTVEAEALDRRNQQRAAMVWGGAANAFTNQARFSPASDAYDLAGEFGQDFGGFLATGVDPFKAPYAIPNLNRIRVTVLGERPLDPDCERFGRAPGIDGIIGDYLGLPPDWTDKGARPFVD
ncbi:hypothetical protein ASG40_05430 [Methylobacterium sp. Leaf399]|uniref:DUF3313 domain-containing protein n=1 Tax=unclassified Methylobacterium TaxID=2615210 RepID=UPI0006F86FC3|nr:MULTISPECIES: DUF3313 domain-containing protein [unclassified Methylobacterium]KQP52000.1 hypothetical protein ASF39_08695 [Methylobacterium sp. Leaf108]KQT14945.1 hypothetical protein ASG40_05430 [Methylobacterium sp. Leaf399]KQT90612.1 hypothetical protein ASG59_01050 [Methylobacterium sp. Leaf466]